jgi:hypothetical protein
MKTSTRVSAIALALATGAALFVPFAAPASAAGISHVSCAKVTSGTLKSGNVKSTFASCTPTALKGGTGSTTKSPPPGSKKGQVGFKVTWSGGKGTTTAAISFAVQKTTGKCPAAYTTRIKATGTVKAATGAAKAITKVGEPVTASQCVIASGPNAGKSTIEPGTKFKL